MSAFSIVIIAIVVIVALVLKSKNKDNSQENVSNNTYTSTSNEVSSSLETNNTAETYGPCGEFSMKIEDVFTITGRGTVVTGRVEKGMVRVNDVVKIDGTRTTTVLSIEQFRKKSDVAQVGDAVGLLLKDITRNDVSKGQIITK